MICLVHSTARSAISLGEDAPPPLVGRRRAVMESSVFWFATKEQKGKHWPSPLSALLVLSLVDFSSFFSGLRHLVLPVTSESVGAGQPSCLVGHTHTHTQVPRQIHMVLAHSLARSLGRWLKVSTVKPILSLFLCALFPSVLVFFTPPVTMCHHLPSQRHSHSYLQTLPKNIQGQNKNKKTTTTNPVPFVFRLCSQSLLRVWGS